MDILVLMGLQDSGISFPISNSISIRKLLYKYWYGYINLTIRVFFLWIRLNYLFLAFLNEEKKIKSNFHDRNFFFIYRY